MVRKFLSFFRNLEDCAVETEGDPNIWAIGTIEKSDIKEFEVANKAIRKLCKKNGFAYANVMKCVRIFLIGQSQGPPIKDIISQLGQKEALIRLKSGLDNCLLNKSAGEE